MHHSQQEKKLIAFTAVTAAADKIKDRPSVRESSVTLPGWSRGGGGGVGVQLNTDLRSPKVLCMQVV